MTRQRIIVKNLDQIELAEAFNEFINEKTAMNCSLATIKDYAGSFRSFCKFVVANNEMPDEEVEYLSELDEENQKKYIVEKAKNKIVYCSDLNGKTITAYLLYLSKANPNLKDTSKVTYVRHLRAIFNYFMRNGYTNEFDIVLPHANEVVKVPYTDEEVAALTAEPDMRKNPTFCEIRDWAMACWCLATGNRRKTVSEVKIEELDLTEDFITLTGLKNRKVLRIPISPSLKQVLKKYLKIRGGGPGDYLFCTQYGEKMTPDGISTAIQRYNASRGVARGSIHLYRHTFAKTWIVNGGDMYRLQEILGHKDLEMVRRYVALYGKDLQNGYDRFSALDISMRNAKQPKEKIKVKKLGSR